MSSKTNVLFNFGRKDKLDLDQDRRLIKHLSGVLPEKEALEIQAETSSFKDFRFKGGQTIRRQFLSRSALAALGD